VLFRIGFEIVVECPDPTTMLLALRPHPSIQRTIIGTDHIRTEPETRVEEYTDELENRRARVLAPRGTTAFWSDSVIEDSGKGDPFD
jgi:transglutaminase-like putative cysteine protease